MVQNISVIFPGQGSQYNGMGKDFYNSYSIVREIFAQASLAAGYDIHNSICEEDQQLLSYEKLFINILTLQYSSYEAFLDCYKTAPSYLVGHSLGEISALVCSGALKLSDAIEVVRKRGQLMGSNKIPEGKMVAVMGFDIRLLNQMCEKVCANYHEIVEVANCNSAEQVIISGSIKAVDMVLKEIEAKKSGMVMALSIKKPFHTKMMEPIKKDFYDFCKKFEYKKCAIPVVSNVTARPYEDNQIAEYLAEQLVRSVQWMASITYLAGQKSELLVEMPPQNILRNLLLTNEYGIGVYSFDNKNDQQELDDILVPINHCTKLSAKARLDFMARCLVVAVSTGVYVGLSDNELKEIEDKYQFIQQQMMFYSENEVIPSNDVMQQSLFSLLYILTSKGMEQSELDYIIDELLVKTGTFYYYKDFNRRRDG